MQKKMKMVWHKAVSKYIGNKANFSFCFIYEEQVMLLIKEYLLLVVTTIVDMKEVSGREFHGIKNMKSA